MPAVTPSRLAIAVLVFSLATFFWTYGYPQQLSQPAKPIIDHYEHVNVHSEPIIPAPSIATRTKTRHATDPRPTKPASNTDNHGANRWKGATDAANATATPASTPPMEPVEPVEPVEPPPAQPPTNPHISKFCQGVRGAPHVMVIVRTSKAEMADKLPIHLKGLLSCVPNFAIFSDHEGTVEGIPVHNALASIDGEIKRTHDEFHEYQLMHADPEHKPDAGKTKNLDKWKFLPMVYKAFHLRPSARFFFFIEMDTSLSWTNTLQWMNRLDYRIPYYTGSVSIIDGVSLAQRGSGFMVSQGAMRRYAKSYDELYTTKWEERVGKGCCGDLALAQALTDAHVEFYSSWPLLQGEQPATLDFSEKHWCTPAVSWHHTNGEVLENIWDTQTNWTSTHGWETPFLFRDAFEMFVQPKIGPNKRNWDNLSSDTMIAAPQGRRQQLKDEAERRKKHKEEQERKKQEEMAKQPLAATHFSDPPREHSRREDKKEINWDKIRETYKNAGDSPEDCQKTCEAVENCLQWRYASNKGDGECHLGKVLKLGKRVDGKGEQWTSGWLLDRVEKVKKNWECKEPNWRFYQ